MFAHQIISDFDTPNVAIETEKIFQFLPEHYARFINEWSAGINRTLEKYQIDQKVSAETLKLRVRFNNYFAQIIMDLNAIQKTNKRVEPVY